MIILCDILPFHDLHQNEFVPLYRRIAARKLIFFFGRNGSLRIKDLVASQTVLAELGELRIENQTEDQLLGSWFSLQVSPRLLSVAEHHASQMPKV